MEISVNSNSRQRRRHGEIRLLEKQLRPEIIERCLQFLDIIINQIIYQENIYPSNLFQPKQFYRTIVYQSIDKNLSSYITLCISCLRDLFSQQLFDMISINIIQNSPIPILLRRYLIELHTIHDPCLRAIYDNTKQLINQLEQIFQQTIQIIKQIKPLDNQCFNKRWTFQFRSIPTGRNTKGITIDEILRQKPIYKEFILINQQFNSQQSTISLIKSLHSERVKLQLMCEDDKYEQEKFRNLMNQQETDSETDTDIEDEQNDRNENSMKIIKLADRYQVTQNIDRENFDTGQYSSDDDVQPQSPSSPNNNWQEENDEEEEEDF